MHPPVRVTTAREAAARDSAAIAAGTASSVLMARAGEGAAAEIVRAYRRRTAEAVAVLTGAGNNGGDGWVVARALATRGADVRVIPTGEPRTPDAIAAREAALATPGVGIATDPHGAAIVVDALLGTGSSGRPRPDTLEAIRSIATAREKGSVVVSLDLPSGLDPDSGDATNAVRADLTVTFGTVKRGLLLARGATGRIHVVDIGLPDDDDRSHHLPVLVTADWARANVPSIAADAHKGTRKKLAIVGGQAGMAGATVLAARAAMRSGIGMVRLVVARDCIPVVQAAEPYALAAAWPMREEDARDAVSGWADVVLIGPGLGDSPESRALAERVLTAWRGPVVIDADGLNIFKGDLPRLRALLGAREALLTPHAAEFARLMGTTTLDVLTHRFEAGAELARDTGAAVLLKGVPTVITAPSGARWVSAAGTAALAAAGSGDLLAGIAATLLAHTGSATVAGACAAWAHGRAAEIAGEVHPTRGVALADVVNSLSDVWRFEPAPPAAPVLAELPDAGTDAVAP